MQGVVEKALAAKDGSPPLQLQSRTPMPALHAPLRRLFLAFCFLWMAGQVQAEAILHAFNWRYADVEARASEIRLLGYSGVLVAPPLKSEGGQWWARYQPQDYRVIDHPLGNTEDFIRMSAALEARGLALYADLVLNHMANEAGQRADLNYPGQRILTLYAGNTAYWERQRLFGNLSSQLFVAGDFNPAFCITNYNSVTDVQTGRLCSGGSDAGLPDLQGSSNVITRQREYLAALVTLGVDGFRLDAAKHMTLSHVNALFAPPLIGARPVYGELITGGGTGNGEYELFLRPWMQQTTLGAYDFPLFHRMRTAFGFGGNLAILVDPEADGQAIDGTRALTFAVNHDIPLNGIFRGQIMDATDETLAWAWLFARGRGTPLLYSDNNESGDGRWVNLYRRADIAAMLRFHNATAGDGLVMISASACHLLFRRGARGVVGINKCGEPRSFDIPTEENGLPPGRIYRDVIAGDSVSIRGETLRVEVPARTARLWLLDTANNTCGTLRQRIKERISCTSTMPDAPSPPLDRRDNARRGALN